MTHTNTRPSKWRHCWSALVFLVAVLAPTLAHALSTGIVISQVYGGGGNAGSVYTHDFIELHNRGDVPVDISTWSVQYASGTGTSWARTNLSGIIPAGGYYLIQQAIGTGGTTPLPTPDATGTIAMSATVGKVALVDNQTTITSGTSCPTGATIVDFVGFGTTANCFEGSGPTPAPSNTNAVLRDFAGCEEVDNNSTDFTAGLPTPRNSAASAVSCFYTLTATASGNGTVSKSPDQASYQHGASVDVSALADPNNNFVNWTGDASGNANPVSVFMNGNKAVTGNFAPNTFTLTYTAGAGGTVSGTSPQVVNQGADGTPVTAVPDPGYSFVSWSDAVATATRTDTNVQADISVTATFAINTYTLTYTAGAGGTISGTTPQVVNQGADGTAVTAVPDPGYSFVSWSDAVATATRTDTNVQADISVTATFAINTYTLTYTAGTGGTISGTTPQVVNHGDDGTPVTAVPDPGYSFVSWSDAVATATRHDTNVMADVTVSATFAINTYTLTYTAGPGGTISGTTPQVVNHGASGSAVTAVADPGYHFVTWSDAVATASRMEVNVTADISVSASFAINSYTLSVATVGSGSVTRDPDQPNYTHGSVVDLEAFPDPGWHFVAWSGDLTGAANPISLVMDDDKSVTANFAINSYTLDVSVVGSGSVSKNPDQLSYDHGTNVELTATAAAHWVFTGWSGDATGTTSPVTVVMDADKSVTATFTLDTHTLAVIVSGSGTVAKVPDQANYVHGTSVQLTAAAASGWHFVGWSGDATGTANPITIVMDADKIVNLTFEINTYKLAVITNGSGTVTRNPEAEFYPFGTTVEVTAVPAPGWYLVNWTGDASGTDPTVFVYMDAIKSVTAHFAVNTYSLTVNVVGSGSVAKDPNLLEYNHGTSVELQATAVFGYHFVGWSGDATGATTPVNVLMDADKAVTATFAINVYTLTVSTTGTGAVGKSPDQATYTHGSNVQLTATPGAGWFFVNWTGSATGSANPLNVLMDGNKAITAHFAVSGTIVISQIYGGGGNAGATLKNDFIELFNRSDAPVSLAGWSVQYNSATGTGTWLVTPLTGSIAAGGYYLVQQAQGAGGTVDLPTPDATGTIAMALGAGKVALVSTTTALSGCPGAGSVADLVGYGATANCFETAPTATLTNTTAAFRKGNGCVETNNNSADFLTAAPAPRNSASPINTCQYTLTVSADPSVGGTVQRAPNQSSYQLGSIVQVTAVKAYGYHFAGWSGDATGLVNPLVVTMDGDKTFTAHFALNTVAGIVVISQVYGGGGNTGAQYDHDYIELFNRGNASIDLTGWSLQYAAPDGGTWTGTNLIGSIPAGGYLLVQQAAGSGGFGAPLPTPDNSGDIEMGAIDGKVALVSNTTTLTGNCPTGVHIIDFVGYGTSDCSEGSPADDIDNATALFRLENGCRDKDDNLTDFSTAAPAPRNSASPKNPCAEWLSVDEQSGLELALGLVAPNPSRGPLTIPFSLPRESQVRIRVLDVQGRIVASVADGVFAPGRHELHWSGITRSGPARSGVYFVQMNVAGRDMVRRVSVTN
jgi:uncharacterized repeat protein (TIGR02543 family)